MGKFIEVKPVEIEIGDEFFLYVGDTKAYWTCVGVWSRSINRQLFSQENTVIIVPVELADGSRGSRVFAPDTVVKIYRP